MPRTVTVQNMIDAVQSTADIVSDDNISTTDIIRWINEGYAELYDILVSSGLPFFETETPIVTTSNQPVYALPSDFYAPVALNYQLDAETLLPLVELNPRCIHRITFSGSQAFFYRCVVNNLHLYPTPPANQTYKLLYIPAPVQLTTAGQTIDGVSGWEAYVHAFAVIMARDKQDRPVDVQERRLKSLVKRITDAAQNRAIASATTLYEDAAPFGYENADPSDWRQYG
ncbi:MAG TPA: hypothetical protein VIV60_33620 [Polyangiaceae bacterium]